MLVLVPNPLRPFDEAHAAFVGLVADEVGQILVVARDRALEQSRLASLAALDSAKTAFLSSVSHEFRTPLTLLLGPLEDVLSGRADTIERADVDDMYASAHRLLRMVNGLLDVARIEADGLVATPEPTDIAELTLDALSTVRVGVQAGRTGARPPAGRVARRGGGRSRTVGERSSSTSSPTRSSSPRWARSP